MHPGVSELAFEIPPEVLHASNDVSFWLFDLSRPVGTVASVLARTS